MLILISLFSISQNGNVWGYVQDRLKQGSPIPTAEAVHIFRQVCAALHAMHTLSTGPIAHRDVKPHNILLAPQIPAEWPRPRKIPQDMDTDTDGAHLVASCSTRTAVGSNGRQPPSGHPASIAALMDFGSAAAGVVRVESRSEALTLQEHAEVSFAILKI